jgi:hypothetical protein
MQSQILLSHEKTLQSAVAKELHLAPDALAVRSFHQANGIQHTELRFKGLHAIKYGRDLERKVLADQFHPIPNYPIHRLYLEEVFDCGAHAIGATHPYDGTNDGAVKWSLSDSGYGAGHGTSNTWSAPTVVKTMASTKKLASTQLPVKLAVTQKKTPASSCFKFESKECWSKTTLPGEPLGNSPHTFHVEGRFGTYKGRRQWMFNVGGSNAGAEHWLYSGGTKIQFGAWNGHQLHDGTGVTNHTSMTWFSTTWDGATYKLYVNGVLKHQMKRGSFKIISNAVTLGHPHIGEHGFTGCVDKMYMCRKAETATEVADFVKKASSSKDTYIQLGANSAADKVKNLISFSE